MSKSKFSRSSGNPFMKKEAYQKASSEVLDQGMGINTNTERMTVSGAVNKSFLLMAILLATSLFAYTVPSQGLMMGGAIGGLVVVLIAVFKKEWSPFLAPLYAALEGLFVGGISAVYAAAFDGIIVHAVSLTMAVLFMMLFIYKTGIIKVTQKFRMGVMMATGAVFIVYMASFVLSFFGINIPY